MNMPSASDALNVKFREFAHRYDMSVYSVKQHAEQAYASLAAPLTEWEGMILPVLQAMLEARPMQMCLRGNGDCPEGCCSHLFRR